MLIHSFKSTYPRFNLTYLPDPTSCYQSVVEKQASQFVGSGVRPHVHPLNPSLEMAHRPCQHCKSEDVLVIFARQNHQKESMCWDYEIKCSKCGQFSQFSFQEKDN